MKQNKKVLGKGLEALLGDFKEGKEVNISELDIDKIVPNKEQPRKNFENIEELADSIKKHGLLQPILVFKKDEDKYEIIAGERRWRAAKEAGLKKIPVIIKDDINEESKLEIALIENIQRENLDPVEEANAYKFLIEKFKITIEDLAKRLGKSRSAISNTMRLLKLPDEVLDDLKKGRLTPGQVKPLISISSKKEILRLRDAILNRNLSARDSEKLVKKLKKKDNKKRELNIFLNEIKEKIQSNLSTKVNIMGTTEKGKIIIEYYSQDDIERISEYFDK